jgi:hypothetical protein
MAFPATPQSLDVLVATRGTGNKVGIPAHRVRDVLENSGTNEAPESDHMMWKGQKLQVMDVRERTTDERGSDSGWDVIISTGTGAMCIRVESVVSRSKELLAEHLPTVGPRTVVASFGVAAEDGERIPILLPCWFPEENLV